MERSPSQKDTIRSLRTELGELRKEVVRRGKQIVGLNKRLDQEKERSESLRETGRTLSHESLRLHRKVRILRDCEARGRSLSDEVYRLRLALEVSNAGNDKLKARLVKLRALGATLSKLPCDEAAQLRAALRRSRRQKTTINVLRRDNARLRKAAQASKTRREASQAQLAGVRAIRKSLSKSLSGTDAELRKALRRSRRQKATIKSLLRVQPPAALHDAARAAWGRPQRILCDRFRLAELQDCVNGCPVIARRTRWSEASEDIRALRKGAADGPLSVDEGSRDLLAASLSVAIVKSDDAGSVRLVKKSHDNSARDDVAAALVLAAGALARSPSGPPRPLRFALAS